MPIANPARTLLTAVYGEHNPALNMALEFNGDSAYPTGGTPGFQSVVQTLGGDHREVIFIASGDCGGYVAVYDKANDKLKVFRNAAGAGPMQEVPNATDLSAVLFHVMAFCS